MELKAELYQTSADLEEEFRNEIKELQAENVSLRKQIQAAVAKIKQMENKDKVRDRNMTSQQTTIQMLYRKLEQAGLNREFGELIL